MLTVTMVHSSKRLIVCADILERNCMLARFIGLGFLQVSVALA